MFQQESINVPVLGIIENMAYFTPEELPNNKYYIFGKEGAKAAVDFYTDPFDLDKAKTVASIPSNLSAITQGNRAVANNAAGLQAGTNIAAKQTGQGMEPDYSHPNWQSGWWGEIPNSAS